MKPIKLEVVGYDDSIDKPDKDGFRVMRIFSKDKGEYSIKRWNKVGNWTLQKRKSKGFNWITLRDNHVEQIRKGGTLLVDNDILKGVNA